MTAWEFAAPQTETEAPNTCKLAGCRTVIAEGEEFCGACDEMVKGYED